MESIVSKLGGHFNFESVKATLMANKKEDNTFDVDKTLKDLEYKKNKQLEKDPNYVKPKE